MCQSSRLLLTGKNADFTYTSAKLFTSALRRVYTGNGNSDLFLVSTSCPPLKEKHHDLVLGAPREFVVVVVVLMLYLNGKQLWSGRDGHALMNDCLRTYHQDKHCTTSRRF